MLNMLGDTEPAIVVEAVRALADVGVAVAPDLDKRLIEVLKANPGEEVVVAGCEVLALLGRDAFSAMPTLARFATGPSKPRGKNKSNPCELGSEAVRRAAVGAIAKIDAAGEYVVYSVNEAERRECFLSMLHQCHQGDSLLYQRLNEAWNVARLAGPRPGHKRMHLVQIKAFVLGSEQRSEKKKSDERSDDEKKLEWRTDKQVHKWMDDLSLRAIRVSPGLYDVNTEDLNRLRAIYFGKMIDDLANAEESTEPPSEPS